MSEVKQVILFRDDLKVRKGKFAAQVAHASMAVFFNKGTLTPDRTLHIPLDKDEFAWVAGSFAKVVLLVPDEASLLQAYQLARQAGLPASLITDAGRTEFHGVPTHTAVAIGPARADRIDAITGPQGVISTRLA